MDTRSHRNDKDETEDQHGKTFTVIKLLLLL